MGATFLKIYKALIPLNRRLCLRSVFTAIWSRWLICFGTTLSPTPNFTSYMIARLAWEHKNAQIVVQEVHARKNGVTGWWSWHPVQSGKVISIPDSDEEFDYNLDLTNLELPSSNKEANQYNAYADLLSDVVNSFETAQTQHCLR